MADLAQFSAYIVVQDSAKKKARVDLGVDSTDIKAYVAAADTAARTASKVGILLNAVADMIADHPNCEYKHGVDYGFLQSTFDPPVAADQLYRSNKLKVDYATTNAGMPATGSFTIPMRDPAEYTMESNGVNVAIDTGATTEIDTLIAAIIDTLVSKYATAVTGVTEITVNDE